MFASRDPYDDDLCPDRDELLGAMYRANANGLPHLVETVSPDVRARLALFCYHRSHLHSLALAIAGSCSEHDLIEAGGRVGATLYRQSRQDGARSEPSLANGRKPITLPTRPLAPSVEDDEVEDEDTAEAVTG